MNCQQPVYSQGTKERGNILKYKRWATVNFYVCGIRDLPSMLCTKVELASQHQDQKQQDSGTLFFKSLGNDVVFLIAQSVKMLSITAV